MIVKYYEERYGLQRNFYQITECKTLMVTRCEADRQSAISISLYKFPVPVNDLMTEIPDDRFIAEMEATIYLLKKELVIDPAILEK